MSDELKPNTGLCPELDGTIRGLCFVVFYRERKFVVMAQDREDARAIFAHITGGKELCEECVGSGELRRVEESDAGLAEEGTP